MNKAQLKNILGTIAMIYNIFQIKCLKKTKTMGVVRSMTSERHI